MINIKLSKAPDAALIIFGNRFNKAEKYAKILASSGLERGLIGPNEVHHIWNRHILNGVFIKELLNCNEQIIDLGSGAGIPGIPLALAREDIGITLIEPLLKRSKFLHEIVAKLDLNVEIIRERIGNIKHNKYLKKWDVVVSRAVAPLDKLTDWSIPLLQSNGRMISIRGKNSSIKLKTNQYILKTVDTMKIKTTKCGIQYLDSPTFVVITYFSKRKKKSI